MAGLNDEKFKQMQDEMSRFEEEIGLPMPERPKVIGTSTYSEVEKTLAGETPRPVPLPNGLPPPPPGFIPPRPPRPPIDVSRSPMEGSLPFSGPPMYRGPMPPVSGPPLPPVSGQIQSGPSSTMQGSIPPGMPPPPPGMGFGPMMPPPMMPPMPSGFAPGFPPQMMPPSRFIPPQESSSDKSAQSAPAVLSATPMLYVANPQLEIAAHQAAETGSGGGGGSGHSLLPDLPLEHDRRGPKKPLPPIPPPSSKKKDKKNRKLVRTAGGQTWEDPTLAEWDDDDFRLFCGDLGNDVTDEVLTRAFSKYGSFVKAKVIRDKRTNKTKGFGFVSFKDPQDFIRATKEMNGRYVGSRPIKLRKSTWKNRCLDVVRKKDKEKAALINMLTGR